MYRDKLLATNNADEILQSNRNYVNEEAKHKRKDNLEQFARADLLLQIVQNQYKANTVVGTDSNGNMLLYDIVNMQPEKFNEKKDSVSEDYSSSDADTTVSNGIVRNSAETVNSKSVENKKRFALDEQIEKEILIAICDVKKRP